MQVNHQFRAKQVYNWIYKNISHMMNENIQKELKKFKKEPFQLDFKTGKKKRTKAIWKHKISLN